MLPVSQQEPSQITSYFIGLSFAKEDTKPDYYKNSQRLQSNTFCTRHYHTSTLYLTFTNKRLKAQVWNGNKVCAILSTWIFEAIPSYSHSNYSCLGSHCGFLLAAVKFNQRRKSRASLRTLSHIFLRVRLSPLARFQQHVAFITWWVHVHWYQLGCHRVLPYIGV